MAPRLRSAVVRFDALPEAVLRILFLALPVDARAQAACMRVPLVARLSGRPVAVAGARSVSRGGVDAERVTENLVRGADRSRDHQSIN
jgi:hypothetical protein